MSDSLEVLRRQLGATKELKSVVRAMKAISAAELSQYEKSVIALRDYDRTVRLGLRVCLKEQALLWQLPPNAPKTGKVIIVFGSDQGLVGQFNEVLADYVHAAVSPAEEPSVWAVGERLGQALEDRGFKVTGHFALPNSIETVTSLIVELLNAMQDIEKRMGRPELMVFRQSPTQANSWQAGAFLVISVSAYYLLRRQHYDFACKSMKVGLAVALFASLAQLITGDISARGVAHNQPAKLAAYEGLYHTKVAPLFLFGWVDEKNERVRVGIAIPQMLTFLTYGDLKTPVTGLDAFAPQDRPDVNFVFQTYHGMIVIGMGLIALSMLGVFLWWRGLLFSDTPLVRRYVYPVMVASVLGPQIANQLGWFSAEVGRQPWIVYGLLRTSDALSKAVKADAVLTSLILFTFIYSLLFILFLFLLNEKIQHGPEADTPPPATELPPTEQAAIAAAEDILERPRA